MDTDKNPEVLTMNQADEFGDKFIIFGIEEASELSCLELAITYADLNNGQIYTQVDSEEDRVYVKGAHIINRTGIYGILTP